MDLQYDEDGYVIPVPVSDGYGISGPPLPQYTEDEDSPPMLRTVCLCHDKAMTAFLGDDDETLEV